MALKSGLASQIGFVDEVTYGVSVPPTRFLPIVNESVDFVSARLESAGIVAGRRVLTSGMSNGGPVTVSGDIGLELYNRQLGLLFKHMLGTVVTTGAGPFTHTFTPGDLTGKSMTVQMGRPDGTGTVQPFTYTGVKVASWEIACNVGEIATLGLTIVGQNEIVVRTVADGVTTSASPNISSATAAFTADDIGKPISGTGIPAATTILSVTSATAAVMSANATASGTSIAFTIGVALATASYTAVKPLKFLHGSVSIAGSSVKVIKASIKGDNGLADSRRFLGQATIDEPLEQALRVYDGTLDLEFNDMTQYRRYLNATEVALVVAFNNGTDSVTITENVRFDGDTPNISGPDILTRSIAFKALASGVDSTAITIVLVNPDTTP